MAYIDLDNLRTILLDDKDLRARKLERRHCGVLQVTSGRIVGCDPLVQPERQAFVRSVQAGSFPVEVLQDSSHALAVLWLRERGACAAEDLRWEMALLPDEEIETLGEDEFFGYPVDAGVGCFMDADAAAAMEQREKSHADDPHFNYYDNVLADEMGDGDIADHYPLGAGSANNMVIFRSGWGDGAYPSYWALDANGVPVALVTDFMTIQGGDARSDDDKRDEAYLASLSPERLAALEALSDAVTLGEAEPIRVLLAGGLAGANDIVPSSGETPISSAIRLDKTEALRALLDGRPCPDMPEPLRRPTMSTYLEYALVLKEPRDPALIAVLEQAQAPLPGTGAVPANEAPAAAAAPSTKGFWARWFS